jgi:hypothetical protein
MTGHPASYQLHGSTNRTGPAVISSRRTKISLVWCLMNPALHTWPCTWVFATLAGFHLFHISASAPLYNSPANSSDPFLCLPAATFLSKSPRITPAWRFPFLQYIRHPIMGMLVHFPFALFALKDLSPQVSSNALRFH